MNIDDAKQITMYALLECLGHVPVEIRHGEAWYLSPFRKETEASFKLTRDGYAWFDHGAGRGGDLLNFVMEFYDTDMSGALRALAQLPESSTLPALSRQRASTANAPAPAASMTITALQPVTSQALIHYLHQRGIPLSVAHPYVQEMHYERDSKPYFALAFANARGGYELRNPYFQGTHGSKDISIIQPDCPTANSVAVFEGFMDFLSAIVLARHPPRMPVIVMNSVAMYAQTLAAIQALSTDTLYLYADRDDAGRRLASELQAACTDHTVHDMSAIYANHKDLNDYLLAKTQHRQVQG